MTIAEKLTAARGYHQAGQAAEAEAIYQQILAEEPNHLNALHLLGALLGDCGRFDEAIQLIGRALAIKPNAAVCHGNLGAFYYRMGKFPEAIASFNRAAQFETDGAKAHYFRATALKLDFQFERAAEEFAKSIQQGPNDPDAHWHYARLLLTMGNYAKGWEEYEWRLAVPTMRLNRGFQREKQWDGSDAAGKTVLVHAEGGFGDTLQFVRFFPMLAGRAGRLIFECQPALVSLLKRVKGFNQIIARGEALPEFDFQIPLLSVPRILEITLENLPNAVPYVSAPADHVAYWMGRLPADGQKRIGLVWAGSGSLGDARTRLIDVFAPLGRVAGVHFVSLQTGVESLQTPPEGLRLIDFSAELHDFAETAALVENLDLVISVDTAAAHLAGAMGKAVWVLIPLQHAGGDFRWPAGREDSPWYPTMRLFFQPRSGDWGETMERIAGELQGVAT